MRGASVHATLTAKLPQGPPKHAAKHWFPKQSPPHLSALEPLQRRRRARALVMLVARHQGRRDLEAVQQLARVARVLRQHDRRGAQHAQRARRRVLEVADGRADDVEAGRQRRVGGRRGVAAAAAAGSGDAAAIVVVASGAAVAAAASAARRCRAAPSCRRRRHNRWCWIPWRPGAPAPSGGGGGRVQRHQWRRRLQQQHARSGARAAARRARRRHHRVLALSAGLRVVVYLDARLFYVCVDE